MSSASLLKGLLAIAIATAPIGQAAAQQASHFYRIPLQGVNALPPDNPAGNPALTAGSYGSATAAADAPFSLAAPSVTGGTAPYAFSANLPSGMSLSAGGAISGAISTPGTYSGTVTITDSSSPQNTASAPFSVTITAPPTPSAVAIALQGSIPAEAMVGIAIPSVSASASGGTSPYAFSMTGTPPTGLSVLGNVLGGTPTQAGSFTYGIQVSDSQSSPSTQSATGTTLVYGALTASMNGTPSQTVETGSPIATTSIAASGGKGPYTYTISAVPPGMTFSNGTLSGAPTLAGTYNLSFTALESFAGQTTTLGPYTLTVTNPPAQPLVISASPATPTEAIVGSPIATSTFSHTGGTGAVTYEIVGSPPTGVSLTGSILQGTPQSGSDGSYNFFIRATDSGSPAQSELTSVAMTVYAPFVPAPDTAPQTSVTIGSPIAPVTVNATGGKPPYIFGTTGSLPPGVTFSNAGVLSGTPTQIGTFNYRLTASHSFTGAQVLQTPQYTMTVNDTPAVAIAPATPPANATRNVAIAATNLNPSGGVQPYTYALIGTAPAGLTFTGNQLTGTPTVSGDYSFQIRITDSTPNTPKTALSPSYTMAVRDPVVMTSTVFANATANIAYSFQLTASGGSSPYTYAVVGLPGTLTASSSGLITGTPNSAQNYTSLSVTVTDSVGRTDTKTASLTVLPPPPAAIPRPNAVATPGGDAGQGQYVVAGGVNGFYDSNTASGYSSFAGYESGGMPRTTAQYTWTAANKANCAIVGINNRAGANTMSVRFMNGGSVLSSVIFNTPSGLSEQTVVSTAAGNPDINRMDLLVNSVHTNYLAHTFKAGAWDGTTCITSP